MPNTDTVFRPRTECGLAWLLHPHQPREFLETIWGKSPFVVQRAERSFFEGIPNIATVDELIATTAGGAACRFIRYDTDGQQSPSERHGSSTQSTMADVYDAYADGYTIVVNAVEERSARVASICRALEAETDQRTGANYYLTPPGAQGFPAHADTHDVIVAQIDGCKRWRVSASRPDNVQPGELGTPDSLASAFEWHLEPGDILYIPAGFVHEAFTVEDASLHLTFGFSAVTLADLLLEAVQQLVERSGPLRTTVLQPGELRTALPDSVVATVTKLLRTLGTEQMDSAREHLASALLQRSTPVTGRLVDLDRARRLTPTTSLTHATWGPSTIRSAGPAAVLEFCGGVVEFDSERLPWLHFVADNEAFTLSDIPGPNDETKAEFIRELVRCGFLATG
ncbi:cupin domain-containing protein [Gordonia alkanivorans]|uniref:cupin domain-containing protein n=1 Tax=Gordonia alkanivorans TaxID=84096 RepID=UPI001F4D8155|nr:cupin domain-containing protein [Gordonia alkanivorans]